MARRNTLTRTAITGTIVLWATTFAAAVTEIGNERLFVTLRAAALLFAVATVALLCLVFLKAQMDRICGDLHDAVAQAADELHTAVSETGAVLRQDRAAIVAVRALTAELVHARIELEKHDQVV